LKREQPTHAVVLESSVKPSLGRGLLQNIQEPLTQNAKLFSVVGVNH